jgi:PAS domain S-box-containing protein
MSATASGHDGPKTGRSAHARRGAEGDNDGMGSHVLKAVPRPSAPPTGRTSMSLAARDDPRLTRACQEALVAAALDPIVSIDADGVVLEWNPAAERTFGHARAQAVGCDLAELIVPPRLRADHRARLRHAVAPDRGSAPGLRIEMSALRADGSEVPVELTMTRSDFEGLPIFTGALRDLTESRHSQAALRLSEGRFRSLVEQLPCVTYECEFDVHSSLRYISPQIEAWTGYPRAAWIGDARIWQRMIHPVDRDRVLEEIQRCHAAVEPFESEYRLIADDGRTISVLDREQVIYNGVGEPSYTQGILVDVSALRRAEAYTARVLETAHDAFMSIDADGAITAWNSAAERLFGWTAEEAIGRHVRMTVPERLRAGHGEVLHRAVDGPLSLETVRQHRDGHEIPVEIAVSALKEYDSWVFNGFLRDISERVQARDQLRSSQQEVLQRLALAAEYRDDETGQHTRRVGDLAARLAAGLGLAEEEVELLRLAAPLHDVGKIGIPDTILLKRGRLTPAEFGTVKEHTLIGAEMLGGGGFPLLESAEQIARSHHERWDGTGYPHGLSGADIPLAGRIVALADVFDALTHDRPYKAAWSREAALAEIGVQRGRQFDPRLVDAFLALFPAPRGTAAAETGRR